MKIFKKYACLAFICLLSSCGVEKDYWNALPEQSAAVVAIDLPKLAGRAGLNANDDDKGVRRLKEMVKSGLSGSGQLVDKIFADASASGIDLNQKLYLFSDEGNAILGLLAKVSSSSNLADLMKVLSKEQLCAPVRETEGCKWTVLGKWLVSYSDHALLILADNKWSDPSKLARQASMWLRQEDGQGFAAKSDFQELQSAQADLSAWTSLQLLPRKVLTPFTMGLSAEIDLKKVKAVTTVNFEDGKIVADIRPLITDKIMKGLAERKHNAMGTINGKYLDEFPLSTSLWATANLKGKQFYEFLREVPAIRKFFDHSDLPVTLDYGRIFNAIEGDVFFAVTTPEHAQFILWADVKQTDLLNVFTELRPMIEKSNGMLHFEERGKDAYCLATRDGSVMNLRQGPKIFWLGVKNGRFYLTNDEELIDRRVLGLSLGHKEWGRRVPGQMFCMHTDWKGLISFEYLVQQNMLQSIPKMIPQLTNTMTVESADGRQIRLEVGLNDKKQNLLHMLLNQ